MTPIKDYNGISFWVQIEGVFRKSIRVYRVIGTSDFGSVVHFEDVRSKYTHRRHVTMLGTPWFKPFLIPGGKK